MCGIAGFINKNGTASDFLKIKRMTDKIAHRGPDGEGQLCEGNVALGHRRLAIVDLSDLGRQPMESVDGNYAIVFNGEIYNYKELKEELLKLGAVFANDTDTEVILEAYRAWGVNCLPRFNGMWAFALLDRKKREIVFSRDRFAVKPLYILDREELFMFASEPKAIIEVQPEENIPDLVQILRFVGGGVPDAIDEHSWYANIKRFPVASYGVYSLDTNKLEISTYWEPDIALFKRKWIDGRDPIQTFKELFDDAVGIRLRSDVEVGACLSGGLDSSSIVGCCKKCHGVTVRTFSSRYEDAACDEREYIDSVNRFTGSIPVPIYPDERSVSFLESFRAINRNMDGPSGGASLYSHYSVFREVGKRVKVVLDGQGADELFGGYGGFLIPSLRQREKSGSLSVKELQNILAENSFLDADQIPADLLIRLVGIRGYLHLCNEIKKDVSPQLAQMRSQAKITPAFSRLVVDHPVLSSSCKSSDAITKMCLDQTLITSIPHLCVNEDINSMGFSVEVRMPFLDYRIVEFALALDASYKVKGVWQKWIVRKALRRYLPMKIRRRRNKMGYPAPFSRWLRESDEKEDFQRIIFDFGKRNIVPPETIQAHYEAHINGKANMESVLFRYLVLELWLQTCRFDKIPET